MKRIARSFLLLEPLIVAVIVYAYWFADPARTLTLLLLIPVLVARWLAYGRLFTFFPVVGLMLVFIGLGAVSQFVSPYHWAATTINIPALGWSAPIGWGWMMLGCPVMGLALFLYFVEYARTRGNLDGILLASACLGLLVALLALGGTQWNNKADLLTFMTTRLSNALPFMRSFPGAVGGFNANEIAGALAWLTPLMAGLALYRGRWPLIHILAAIVFWMLLLALYLGQSRFAIVGVVVGLAGVIFLIVPAGRRRYLALFGLILFIALEVATSRNFFIPQQAQKLVDRDNLSVNGRLDIYRSALAIIHDYPLTGVGVNLFRSGPVRLRYPAPAYDKKVLPHAHNEFLQVGTDLGIPGLLIFMAWYAFIGVMLVQTWRRGDRSARVVVVASVAGLLAHAAFGMGDAIALWDRFTFVFWWLMGLAAAHYALIHFDAAGSHTRPPANDAEAAGSLPSLPA